MLEKTSTVKRFEYSLLGSELQTDIAKKQYQVLDKVYEFDKKFYFEKSSDIYNKLLGGYKRKY